MSTPKEIFLELIRPDGQPERQLRQYEALHMCLTDPCNTYLRGNRKRGTTSVDRWGTTILFPEDAPGPMPDTREGLAVCPDVTRWRETVHAPDLEAACTEGWDTCRAEARAACGSDHLLAGFMGTGIFEQCHFLMGFEDTLTNLYAHPDEMHALIDYITEYRLTYVRMLIDHLQPDVIFSHDDWGTKNALFMKPEMWREFFKEPYRRFYGYIRSRGVIAIHHADSYLVPIVDDMAEIGIQVWQGVLPGKRHSRPAGTLKRAAHAHGWLRRGHRPQGRDARGHPHLCPRCAQAQLPRRALHPLDHLRSGGHCLPARGQIPQPGGR